MMCVLCVLWHFMQPMLCGPRAAGCVRVGCWELDGLLCCWGPCATGRALVRPWPHAKPLTQARSEVCAAAGGDAGAGGCSSLCTRCSWPLE